VQCPLLKRCFCVRVSVFISRAISPILSSMRPPARLQPCLYLFVPCPPFLFHVCHRLQPAFFSSSPTATPYDMNEFPSLPMRHPPSAGAPGAGASQHAAPHPGATGAPQTTPSPPPQAAAAQQIHSVWSGCSGEIDSPLECQDLSFSLRPVFPLLLISH